MEQAEDEHGRARVGLEAEESLEAVHVLERLVDDGEADDGVDEIRVGAHASEHADEQREAVAHGEETHVGDDVLQPVQKEDDADEEEQMVVAGDHVLGAQIHQRTDRRTVETLEIHGVLAGDAVRVERRRAEPHDGEADR